MALIAVAIIIYFIIPTAKLQLLSEITKIFGEYFQENNEATLIAAFNAEMQKYQSTENQGLSKHIRWFVGFSFGDL